MINYQINMIVLQLDHSIAHIGGYRDNKNNYNQFRVSIKDEMSLVFRYRSEYLKIHFPPNKLILSNDKCWLSMPLGTGVLYWVLACRTIEKQNKTKLLN